MTKPGGETPAPLEADLSDFAGFDRPMSSKILSCWFQRLTPQQQVNVQGAFDAGYSIRQVHEILTEKWGIEIGKSTVAEHRRGDCQCGK